MHQVRIVDHLAGDDLPNVRALIDAACVHDGASAIGEHKFLRVSSAEGASGVKALLAESSGALVGYANTERFPIADGWRLACELVVHPGHRRLGVGSSIASTIIDVARAVAADRVDAWAYHQLPGSRELATKFGFNPIRTLYQIRMGLPERVREPSLPSGVTIRAFQPGSDDDAWLALNNLIFAGHPEQGAWDTEDLAARLEQPWFDPQDFLLAVKDGRMAAYNWLKLDHTQHEGEIYVIGVHPDERRHGFGRSLSVRGLEHMRARGMHQATAYVDGENSNALAMYEGLGFRVDHADLCYSKALKDQQPG